MTVEYLMKFTNSSYKNILVYFLWVHNRWECLDSVPGEQRKLFGFVSPRGNFS